MSTTGTPAQTEWLRRNAWAFGFVWEIQINNYGFEAWHLTWAPGSPGDNVIDLETINIGLSFASTNSRPVTVGYKTVRTRRGNRIFLSEIAIIEKLGETEVFWSKDENDRKFAEKNLLPTRWWTEAPMTWFDEWTEEKGGPDGVAAISPIPYPRPRSFYTPPRSAGPGGSN